MCHFQEEQIRSLQAVCMDGRHECRSYVVISLLLLFSLTDVENLEFHTAMKSKFAVRKLSVRSEIVVSLLLRFWLDVENLEFRFLAFDWFRILIVRPFIDSYMTLHYITRAIAKCLVLASSKLSRHKNWRKNSGEYWCVGQICRRSNYQSCRQHRHDLSGVLVREWHRVQDHPQWRLQPHSSVVHDIPV